MNIKKLKIKKATLDINLIFYNFLKKITQFRLTDNQINNLLVIYFSNKKTSKDNLKYLFSDYIKNNIKRNNIVLLNLIDEIDNKNIEIFILSLKLNLIKDLIVKEAKLTQTIKIQELEGLNQLSLKYDKISTQIAYINRVSGALLSLLFFEKIEKEEVNFISDSTKIFLKNIVKEYKLLKKKGLEANQIFNLLLSESINQSIISSAGVDYEDRIKAILISIGIPEKEITKTHDKDDKSTEFDFFFDYEGRTYGIGAKRTLRERYKQYIKTGHMSKIDVMIEITLGTDLREAAAKAIRSHEVYLFVADEVYNSNKFLQNIEGIYPASKLSIKLLKQLK